MTGFYFVYIVEMRTKYLKTSAGEKISVFFVQKHMYIVNNTCNFGRNVVHCVCSV